MVFLLLPALSQLAVGDAVVGRLSGFDWPLSGTAGVVWVHGRRFVRRSGRNFTLTFWRSRRHRPPDLSCLLQKFVVREVRLLTERADKAYRVAVHAGYLKGVFHVVYIDGGIRMKIQPCVRERLFAEVGAVCLWTLPHQSLELPPVQADGLRLLVAYRLEVHLAVSQALEDIAFSVVELVTISDMVQFRGSGRGDEMSFLQEELQLLVFKKRVFRSHGAYGNERLRFRVLFRWRYS